MSMMLRHRLLDCNCLFESNSIDHLSLGKMSASETALSANMNNLEVKSTSAFNTPISGTPIPTTTMSSETLALLTEAATKALHTEKSFRGKHGI